MKNTSIKYFLLSILVISFYGCDNFADEPMYLMINAATFSTSPEQGSATHRIQDVWVYADGLSIGVFELPARVPILSSDSDVDLDIFAGVRNNGLALAPLQYPFYERIEMNLDFRPGETESITPNFVYTPTTNVAMNEDFEDTVLSSILFAEDFDEDDSSVLLITNDPDHVAYGNSCGSITVGTENDLFQQVTTEIFEETSFGASEVFVEMDFKCEIPFIFGYIGNEGNVVSERFPLVLNTTGQWTKIYIDLSTALNGGEFDLYRLMLAGVPLEEGESGTIWVDNIKLIYNTN